MSHVGKSQTLEIEAGDKAVIIQHVKSYGLADGWSCQMLLRRRSVDKCCDDL